MRTHTHPVNQPKDPLVDLMSTIMLLCRGKLLSGAPFWAYLCLSAQKAKEFYEARERGAVELDDYGTVLEWGEGDDPPAAIKARMRDTYGMRDDFEDMLLKMVEKLQ